MENINELLKTQEELHEDLLPYVEEGKLFQMLRHPLVFHVPYSPLFNPLINKQYKHKKENLKQYLLEKKFGNYVFLHERPYRFNALFRIKHLLSDKEYWDLVLDVWTDSENIWQNIEEWKILLKERPKTKHLFMTNEDRKVFKSLPNTFKIYRGYIPGKNKDGLSYTTDKEKAEWFSMRFDKNGKVLEKIVNKSEVFAYTNSRNEKEIILL